LACARAGAAHHALAANPKHLPAVAVVIEATASEVVFDNCANRSAISGT